VGGQDQTALLKKLAAKLKLTNKTCQELEASSKEKDSLLEGLNGEKIELTSQLEEARRAQQRLEENLTSVSQQLEALEVKYSEAMNRGSYESEVESLREHIGRLERELKNCVETINEKEHAVNQAQMEIEALLSQLKISEKELQRIQDMYEGESVKNEGILNNIGHLESELSVSRDEMIQLAEQFREVSYNYEKSQRELETKDNYIEELERDVEEMRKKVGNLEKGIEERQKIMREKTENLGLRLQEAEQVNKSEYNIEWNLTYQKSHIRKRQH
jgi:chromosome segregation ATPase